MKVLILIVAIMCGCTVDPPTAEVSAELSTVGTDSTAYVPSQSITVSWSGLPGNAHDWIAYAPASSSDTTVTRWMYTGGSTSGSATLEGTATAGVYVVRAYLDNSYAKLAEGSSFTVSSTTVCALRSVHIPPQLGMPSGSPAPLVAFSNVTWVTTGATGGLILPLQLNTGDRIIGVSTNVFGDNTAVLDRLLVKQGVGGTPQTIVYNQSSGVLIEDWQTIDSNPNALDETVGDGEMFVIGYGGRDLSVSMAVGLTTVTYCAAIP